MVSTSVRVPLEVGTNLYQMVLLMPVVKGIRESCAQGGAGSVDCVVAPELSTLGSVKTPPAPGVTVLALAKLSLAGAGATTIKVGKVTVCVVTVVPPPGGGFCTPTEFVLPKLAIKLAGTMAVSCVAVTVEGVMVSVPPTSGFMMTTAFEANPVPVTVIGVAAAFTLALVGETDVIVGGPPRTVNVRALLVPAEVFTVTAGAPPPPVSAALIVAVNCVSLTTVVVTLV